MIKTTQTQCPKCNLNIWHKTTEKKITCPTCRTIHVLSHEYSLDIVNELPEKVGTLIFKEDQSLKFGLNLGTNVVGRSQTCDVPIWVPNFEKMSRRHCRIDVQFNPRKGDLQYVLQDGAPEENKTEIKPSLHHTYLNGVLIEKKTDKVYIEEGQIIKMADKEFTFEAYKIPETLLKKYIINVGIDDPTKTNIKKG